MKTKTSQISHKEEIIQKITKKLNNLIKNEEFRKNWDYFFEPISAEKNQEEEIFSSNFHNPFSKKNLKFWWKALKNSRNRLEINILDDLDEITLKEFQNALEHIEYQQNRNRNRNRYRPFHLFRLK